MNTKYFAMIATIAVVLVGATTLASAGSASATYEKSQATSQANACGNDKLPMNVGCQNVDSQIQGDENVVSQAANQAFPAAEQDNGRDHGHDGKKGGGWDNGRTDHRHGSDLLDLGVNILSDLPIPMLD
ncbi:MAG: hypothetical protein WBX01_00850 [Nitrososphaeraceae archaeon]